MAKNVFYPGFIAFASCLIVDKEFKPRIGKDPYFGKQARIYRETLKFKVYRVPFPKIFAGEKFIT